MSDNPAAYSRQGALDHSREVSKRLSVTARKLRLATSNRSNLFKAVGLRPRMIDKVFTAAVILVTLVDLIIPNLASVGYFGFIASDQYESEARFTVRSSSPAIGKDQLAKVTGLPSSKVVQDTQIVTNYIGSAEILSDLAQTIDIRKIYSSEDVDFVARLPNNVSSERLLEYWEDMVSTAISPSSGIVTVKVRAFSAQDAQDVLKHVVAASEQVVNEVNDRIWQDVISTSRANLEKSAAQLQAAREKLQAARNNTGVLNVQGNSLLITTLISSIQKEVLDLQQRYASQSTIVSRDAPQMKVLEREIKSKQAQVDDLKAQLAGRTAKQARTQPSLADVSLDMSQIELEQTLAEKQFAASVKTLEQVQFLSKQQLIYLDPFLAPTLPEEAEFPRRILWISLIFIGSLFVWGATLGLLSVLRTRLN
ncbi:capsule biosynthesis protein [Neorhizobium sp. SOG26]|uniref:capsule biosynthesis protein n=1 Tax=Neorhizobium sp. SOG26 TaxID=2060726 RepID=UPI000E56EA44|nr:capsule biosynthesis protein [Neorhizobium sp. SOG26]AXV14660.1 capsule biosynthesis protein [Neorhizobium sp. SOG26]